MSFLTAEWRKLAIVNYAIDKDILMPYLPVGTVLDLWNGTCYVSLIGFLFKATKLLGVSIPFHSNFEEVNLRFYVKYKDGENWKRGVVFIKEIVPKFALSFVANTMYRENYEAMPMTHNWSDAGGALTVEYGWRYKKNWQSFSVRSENVPTEIEAGSEAEFITEHYWGYTAYNTLKTYEYEVKHPKWQQYKVNGYQLSVDFGLTYGDNFKFLNQETPVSVMLAEGSAISVEKKNVIHC
ncbi:YqjF family protein [Pedobacter metabolipauper]|uniref:DUF2071 domain-containing protein n=1 Tax=Pedobacter metabolipauper TaxID=425513 RepID=A0A4R6T112_9SPHI|nr:DUF2071 domain-containing protein [Pedobacter metabolipauper]TDQ11170.1 hypothetical protein ATK78_0286 [Pedobacter metabolipauper]